MKTSFWSIAALSFALSAPFSNQYSQEKTPKGVVIYDPSKLGDKFGQAKLYSQITPHGLTTDIVTTDGESIKIMGGQLRDHVGFPSMDSSPTLWRTAAEKLEEMAPKYPLAKNALLEQATIARSKVETLTKIAAEEALRKQRIQAEETLRKQRIEALKAHQAKQIGRVITFEDNTGESYENVKLEAIEPDGITISDSGAREEILFTELSKEIQQFLGYDPKVAAEYLEEKKEREEQERRLAAAKIAQEKQLEAERIAREQRKAEMQATAAKRAALAADASAKLGEYEALAKAGHPSAQHLLGNILKRGSMNIEDVEVSVTKDPLRGLAWIYAAFYSGYPFAKTSLDLHEAKLSFLGGSGTDPLTEEAKELGKVFFTEYNK